jgi:hypothetical protein
MQALTLDGEPPAARSALIQGGAGALPLAVQAIRSAETLRSHYAIVQPEWQNRDQGRG